MSAEYAYKEFVWEKHIIFRIHYARELRIGGFSKNLKSSESPWFQIILLLMNYSWDQSSIVVDTNKLLLSNLSNQLLVLDFGTQMLWAQSWMEGIFQCRYLFVVEKKSLKKDLDMVWKIAKSLNISEIAFCRQVVVRVTLVVNTGRCNSPRPLFNRTQRY